MYTKEYSDEAKKMMRDKLKISDSHLKISEIFATVQGEGPNTGVPVIFIRLQLCNLQCNFCDSIVEGTPILTEHRGWVPIEKIKEGEEIIGVTRESNHPLQNRWIYTKATASRLVHHADNDAVKIMTDDGNTLTCTSNHKVLVKQINTSQDYKWKWVEAGSLVLGDILWSIGKVEKNMVSKTSTNGYIEGWIAGYDTGDGGWSNSHKNTRRYESVDPLLLDRLEGYLRDKLVQFKRRSRTIKTGIIYQLDSHYIPNTLNLKNLTTNELEDKSIEWKRGFIAGFYDAEGFNNATLPCISNQDLFILERIRSWLCAYFDIDSNISDKNLKDGCYKLTIFGGVLGRLKFDAIFQYAKYGHREHWLWHKSGRRGASAISAVRQAKKKVEIIQIDKIDPTDPLIYYDIGSSCGNFIANGLVVHNTPYTWNWEGTNFKHITKEYEQTKYDPRLEIKQMTPSKILNRVKELAGDSIKHVIWTGGEPLVQQKSKAFNETLNLLMVNDFKIEVETNGTLVPSLEVDIQIDQYNVSPKLENSGNFLKARQRDKAYQFFVARHNTLFKFVVCTEADIKEIQDIQERYKIPSDKILLMPEGRSEEEIKQKAQTLVKLCIENGYRFCNRLQVWIWDGALRGV